MKKSLSREEEKVLKMLDIPDFRHLSKDKIVEFTSMLSTMDPEVAKAVLQQFPEFAKSSIEIMRCYQESFIKVLDNNSAEVQSFNLSCDTLIDSLKLLLDKDDLSFDEKNIIIDKMLEIIKMKKDKDTENKKFYVDLLKVLGVATVTVVGIAATILGVSGDNK